LAGQGKRNHGGFSSDEAAGESTLPLVRASANGKWQAEELYIYYLMQQSIMEKAEEALS